MTYNDFMKENYPEIDNSHEDYYKCGLMWNTARLDGIKESKDNYDLGLGHITSFYQSKRAQLKKQVTHWIGKFMIVKAENNRLRIMNKALLRDKEMLRQYAMKIEAGQYPVTIGNHKRHLQDLERTVHEKEPIKC